MEKKRIKITIDGKEVFGFEGQKILEIATENDITIPNLCYHSDLKPKASCRLCIVEITGKRGYQTACSTIAEDGMVIITDNEEISKLRKTNLELLFSQHNEKCGDCVKGNDCRLLNLAQKYNVNILRFNDRKVDFPNIEFGPSIHFNPSKCIDCKNCVEVCSNQNVKFLEVREEECFFKICPSQNEKRDCVYCGQCVVHCPTGALQVVDSIKIVENAMNDKQKTVIFQIAPAVRTSIGEEFGMGYGAIATEKIAAGIRKLGINNVFDVSAGADIVTMEEAEELIQRISKGGVLPMFTSCCPAWVKYLEFYHPELIPNLTSVRSPQILFGGLTKDFWAKKQGIDTKDVFVVSIMPCTAKKYEIKREENLVDGLLPVDAILTTYELACLFKKNGIDLSVIEPEDMTPIWGDATGAGVIYGTSGGVTESALRTAIFKITGKNAESIEFTNLRGLDESKEASVTIDNLTLKVAIVNGLSNAEKLIEKIKDNPNCYHYIEVMACPGGCIGGGGQPMPTDSKIRKLRSEGLYKIDKDKQKRLAHESALVKGIYEEYLNDERNIHKVCHTKYGKREKENNF
ncbi:MAG: [FeFe] hydrogenase, group A [Candidatus Pacebacteria bacterium]|nr:[FeFe] hydrogenase, group A [Candidatus Paceibacterota bacterium]